MRSDVRAGAPPRRQGHHARARRSRRRLQSRLPVPEGHRAEAARVRSRPAASTAGATGRRLARSVVGRRLRRGRAGSHADPRAARSRCRRDVHGQPQRPQPRRHALQPRAHPGGRHQEHVLGRHRRPDAQAGLGRAHVRHGAEHADPGHRSHRLPADPRRQPVRVERQPHDRARLSRAAPRPACPRAASSSSSIPGGPRPPKRPTSTCSSGRAPMLTSSSASCTRCSTRGSSRSGPSPTTSPGVEEVERLAGEFSPEAVAPVCGIDAATIRRTARELATASRAAVYGRIGTCTQEYGTLASWLVDVANTLTGNLDRPGGAMFTKPAAGSANTVGTPGIGRGARLGRHRSRVRGLPEMFGELPVVCLAEEIETPGEGQVRGMITVAGNPVLSTPNAGRLDRALGVTRLHGERRHLSQRDDATRQRHLAAGRHSRPRPVRAHLVQLLGSQCRELLTTGGRARAGRDGRVRDPPAPGRDRLGPGRGGRPRCARRRRRRRARAEGGAARRLQRQGPRPRRVAHGAVVPPRARAHPRPHAP